MLLSLVQSYWSTSSSTFQSKSHTCNFQTLANPTSTLLPKSLFPGFSSDPSLKKWMYHSRRSYCGGSSSSSCRTRNFAADAIQASLLESPVLWAGRVCVFYALLRTGLAGSKSNPLVSDLDGERGRSGAAIAEAGDFGFSKLLRSIIGDPDKEAADRRKLVSKWHATTKGTLRRNYRVPSKTEGRRLLRAVAALLSEDDHFTDATSHKGCQIRRESAHGESVCCNNVRALFDELPTPHLTVEITPSPVGTLTEDYFKAEKLERVLRSSPSV